MATRLHLSDAMLQSLRLPISASELSRRTFNQILEDNCMGMAAQLAFYFALALAPALIFLVAVGSYFPRDVIGDIVGAMSPVAPPEVVQLVRDQLDRLLASEDGGLLTIGVLGALWSSSTALTAVVDTLNRAYDIKESRPWWKVRLIAIGLTIGMAVLVLAGLTLLLVGPELGGWIADQFGLGTAFEVVWNVARWVVIFSLVALAIGIVYYVAPDAEQEWVWITPGSLLATLLWIAISIGFRLYVVNFGEYNATYGALAGAAILLLWFYLFGLAILIGGELNAEIEHASPLGKDPGEKRPGARRRLVAFARRRAGLSRAPGRSVPDGAR